MNYLEPNPQMYNVPFRTDDFKGMPYRYLGSTGLRVSNIGLGTWKIGYPETGDGSRVDEQTAYQIFDRALELGVTFWDTANRYNQASGNSERIIGKWLKRNASERRNIVLATKMFGGMDGVSPNHNGLSRANILDSVYASLQRLQVDYIDLLYFHGFDPHVPVEESLSTIEDLVSQGIIRYFAVSNFTVDQLKLYKSWEQSLSVRCRIAAVQNQFDVINQEPEPYSGVLETCATMGISFVPWSPLARGLLTERYLNPSSAGPGDRLYDEGTIQQDTEPYKLMKIKQLASLAQSWDMSISQLVLAYMLTIPGMGPMIPSSTSVEQLEANAAAGKIKLDANQIAAIQNILKNEK